MDQGVLGVGHCRLSEQLALRSDGFQKCKNGQLWLVKGISWRLPTTRFATASSRPAAMRSATTSSRPSLQRHSQCPSLRYPDRTSLLRDRGPAPRSRVFIQIAAFLSDRWSSPTSPLFSQIALLLSLLSTQRCCTRMSSRRPPRIFVSDELVIIHAVVAWRGLEE